MLASTQLPPLLSMFPGPLETTVLPMILLGQKAEIPKALFKNSVLTVAVP